MKSDDVFDAITDIAKLATELIPLSAIWLDKPLQMEGKRSIRITNGDRVYASTIGGLLDCSWIHPATHEITECRGTLYSTLLEVDVRDLKTNELLTIKL